MDKNSQCENITAKVLFLKYIYIIFIYIFVPKENLEICIYLHI